MKIAVLSDIHANIDALEAVFSSSAFAQADCVLIAGDLIGYYFDPRECLDLLLSCKKPLYIIRGNHEEMLLAGSRSANALAKITEKYGPGIKIALEQFSTRQVNWVANLPHPLFINELECQILLCHGSPSNINNYVYPNSPIEVIVNSLDILPQVLVMGHTHYPMVRYQKSCLIVNPGSVGQPRNRSPGAHWALIDTGSMCVKFQVEEYDSTILQAKCVQFAPSLPYLSHVLTRA